MVGLSRLLWDGVKGSHVKDRVVVEEVFEVLSPACIDMNSGHTMRRKIQLGSVKSNIQRPINRIRMEGDGINEIKNGTSHARKYFIKNPFLITGMLNNVLEIVHSNVQLRAHFDNLSDAFGLLQKLP